MKELALRAICGLRTGPGRRGLVHGVLPTGYAHPFLKELLPNLVIDVGANRGQFSLEVLASIPKATILAFEPIPSQADIFESILGRCNQVRLIRCALGASTSIAVSMNLSRATDSSSILPIGPEQVQNFRGTKTVGQISIDVHRLDSFMTNQDRAKNGMLKIDVQGYELEVLRGATALLDARWPVLLEASFSEFYLGQPLFAEIAEYLRGRDYVVQAASAGVVRKHRTVQQDFLFVPSERR